jgi:hypothetical protein
MESGAKCRKCGIDLPPPPEGAPPSDLCPSCEAARDAALPLATAVSGAPGPAARPGIPEKPAKAKGEDEAKAILASWKRKLPPAKPAYVPSGVLPSAALGLMAIGTPVGSLAGALAAACVLVAGVLVLQAVAGCAQAYHFGVAGLAFVALYFAAGVAAGSVVCAFGRMGRNRNLWVPQALAMLSGTGSVALFILGGRLFGGPLFFDQQGDDKIVSTVRQVLFSGEPMSLLLGLLGVVIALLGAHHAAGETVRGAKFCEPCQLYLTRTDLPRVALQSVEEIREAVIAGEWERVAACIAASPGSAGSPVVSCCGGCQAGYFETLVKVSVEWGGDKSKSEEWLAVSTPVGAEVTQQLRRVAGGA